MDVVADQIRSAVALVNYITIVRLCRIAYRYYHLQHKFRPPFSGEAQGWGLHDAGHQADELRLQERIFAG